MNKRQKAKHRRDARAYLNNARKTAKLRKIPKPSKDDIDRILMPDGSRYEEIMDDLADMKACLELGGFDLTDIGTDEAELAKLKKASDRLNVPHRERVRRAEADRSFRCFGDDDV